MQSLDITAGRFNAAIKAEFLFDWQINNGTGPYELDQSKAYHFTTGFLQPTIPRYNSLEAWQKVNPDFYLSYRDSRNLYFLFSKTNDFILYGFAVYNHVGQLLMRNNSITASGFLRAPIELSSFPNGIYYLRLFYLPEGLNDVQTNQYWERSLKIVKQ